MTEKQAKQEGLSFTGHYKSYDSEGKLKAIAKQIRSYGVRAVLVSIDHGMAIYADSKYDELQNAKRAYQRAEVIIKSAPTEIKKLQAKIVEMQKELITANAEVAKGRPAFDISGY